MSEAQAFESYEAAAYEPDETDRRIIQATQKGLPLSPRPYHAVAEALDLDPRDVMARLRAMAATGALRRIAVLPNHYALGYGANAMTVWDVDDHMSDELGRRVAALDFVSHCYLRPRHPPQWTYNLFAMVHGREEAEVREKMAEIAALLHSHLRSYDKLLSTRILKKTGLRIT